MDSLELSGRGIRDEEISQAAPLVRALLVQRLEQLWTTIEPHVTGAVGKPDPRMLELGLRTCDRLARLYRLEQPVPAELKADDEALDRAALVLKDLEQIEARMNGSLGL